MNADLHPFVIELGFIADEVHAALAELAVRPTPESASNAWLVVENARALVLKVAGVIREVGSL